MPKESPDSPSSIPADEPPRPRGGSRSEPAASSIQYLRIKEARVPVPILLVGLLAVAAAIIVFLHFHRA